MQRNPNREKLSPYGWAILHFRGGLRHPNIRVLCPCCGGSLGIRAAFRVWKPWDDFSDSGYPEYKRFKGRKPRAKWNRESIRFIGH